jgi:hypothetical protein
MTGGIFGAATAPVTQAGTAAGAALAGAPAAAAQVKSAKIAQLVAEGYKYDPITGLLQDPSGRNVVQVNPDGSVGQVHDLDLGSQVAKNLSTADYYKNLGSTYNASVQNTLGREGSLADSYLKTIQDPNAPSVARNQLEEGLQAAEGTQEALASGGSGNNALVARTNAANNIAAETANTNQSAALLRGQETASAQSGLGTALNNMGALGQNMFQTTTGLGQNFSQLGGQEEEAGNSNVTTQVGQDKQLVGQFGQATATGASNLTKPVPSGAGTAAAGA